MNLLPPFSDPRGGKRRMNFHKPSAREGPTEHCPEITSGLFGAMKRYLPSLWPHMFFSPLPTYRIELSTNTQDRAVQKTAHNFCFCSGLRGQMPTVLDFF